MPINLQNQPCIYIYFFPQCLTVSTWLTCALLTQQSGVSVSHDGSDIRNGFTVFVNYNLRNHKRSVLSDVLLLIKQTQHQLRKKNIQECGPCYILQRVSNILCYLDQHLHICLCRFSSTTAKRKRITEMHSSWNMKQTQNL